MHRTALAIPLALGIASSAVASAQESAGRPSAAPATPSHTPLVTSSAASTSPTPTPPTTTPPATSGTASVSATAPAAPIAPASTETRSESAPAAPPPAEKKGGRVGYIVGGVVSVAVGFPLMLVGAALLSTKPSGCGGFLCLDLSEMAHVMGGITLGLNAPGALAGIILLGVAASRSDPGPDAKPKTSAVPVITLGVGHASARWTF